MAGPCWRNDESRRDPGASLFYMLQGFPTFLGGASVPRSLGRGPDRGGVGMFETNPRVSNHIKMYILLSTLSSIDMNTSIETWRGIHIGRS